MNRRQLLSLAPSLILPWQPERVYSFATTPLPQWRRGAVTDIVTWNADTTIKPAWPTNTRWRGGNEPLWFGQNLVLIHHVNGGNYAEHAAMFA